MALANLINLKEDMKTCMHCGHCKVVLLPVVKHEDFYDQCPACVHFHFHGHSGGGRSIMGLSLVDGRIEPDEDLADIVFACNACGYCDVACKFMMDSERHLVNTALREHMVENGLSPTAHRKSIENIKIHGHFQGKPKQSRGAWSKGLDLKRFPEENAEVLLFAGCSQQNDENAAATTRKLAGLLKAAGVNVGILGDDEPCCGLPAYWRGYRDVYTARANENVRIFNELEELGVKSIVTASGSCLGNIKSKYPEYVKKKHPLKVLHATEILAELVGKGRLKLTRPVEAKVTYHDPCYMGRQSEPPVHWNGVEKTILNQLRVWDPPKVVTRGADGVYDAPRKLLNAIPGLTFTEMYRIREYAYCCGAGGAVPEVYPEMAQDAALERIKEAKHVGAAAMVTACPYCENHFRSTQTEMEIFDIIDLVYQSAGLEG